MKIIETEWPIVFITKRSNCPYIFFLNNKDLRCKHPLRWNWNENKECPECIKKECPFNSVSPRVKEAGMNIKMTEEE
jgi:hypothetical protein